jgi:Ca-activated chloride channel family protein
MKRTSLAAKRCLVNAEQKSPSLRTGVAGRSLQTIAALLAVSAVAWAQFRPVNPPPAPAPPANNSAPAASERIPPTFSVGVNLVRLLVSVRDGTGRLLTDLNKDDFRLMDTGVAQQIAVFERNTSVPLSVAVLIDTSGSTQQDLHYEEDSVGKFLSALLSAGNPEDTFALYSFNWRITQELDFGRSKSRAERMLHGLHGEGGTSLYDAIYLASDGLAQREGRHVMIVVTDGGDTTSYKHFGDALRAAQQADTVLYPIVVVPIENEAGRNIGGEHALASIAASTGGRIFNPDGFAQLDQAFSDLLRELRTQYLIGYYPKDVRQEPRLFHPVKVAVHEDSLRVSARSGYYDPW